MLYSIHLCCRYVHLGGRRKIHHLRAVFVCGSVVEGRNYLLIFGLGSIVTHRVHKLQRGRRETSDVYKWYRCALVCVCVFGWGGQVTPTPTHTHTHMHAHTQIHDYTNIMRRLQVNVCVADTLPRGRQGCCHGCFVFCVSVFNTEDTSQHALAHSEETDHTFTQAQGVDSSMMQLIWRD